MRRALVIAALVLVASGCGGTETSGGSAGDALAYLAANSATVVLVSTDVDGEQWEQVDRRIYRPMVVGNEDDDSPETLEEFLTETAKDAGLDWADDVKPLLGNDIVVGIEGDPMSLLDGIDGESTITAALDTRGGDVEEVLDKAKFVEDGTVGGATLYRPEFRTEEALVAVEDGVLVFADDEEALRRAIARRDNGDGLDEAVVDDALSDLPDGSLVRAFGTLDGLEGQEELRRFAGLLEPLESWRAAVRFQGDDLEVDIAVGLDSELVEADDLPVVTGEESPEIVPRDTEISGGNRNQSQTTAFLLRAVQAAYPDSRFVRAVDALDEDLGISFEEEILRQFNGPSASYVSPDGRIFAARSEVRDPEALRRMLPRIAPHLPALAEGLQGLQSEGMALLFLFAPDAPAATPMTGVQVDPPATADGLYRISGLTGDGPSEVHLGLVGDVFVVASDEQRAREIAEADTVPAEGAKGAGVLRADLTQLERATALLPIPIEGKELVASLEASTTELRARVRVELD